MGLDGLELKYDKLLAGRDGFEREEKDARRRPIGVTAEDYLPPQHGQHLVLTIDANLQMIAEEELRDTVEHFKGSHADCHGEVVVMDPNSGDVLALANYPTFNPQTLSDSTKDVRRDTALVAPYEPGSTFKPFIAGPAFAEHVTDPSEMWTIPAITWHTPYGRAITDVHHYGNLCTWDGLVKSSNILMSQLSERMGNTRLYQAVTGFGFGKRTGIDLPGENGGKVSPLNKWTHYSTESIAQGYELMVTPLQIARAFCAIANGGKLVTPRMVMGTVDPAGNVLSRQKRRILIPSRRRLIRTRRQRCAEFCATWSSAAQPPDSEAELGIFPERRGRHTLPRATATAKRDSTAASSRWRRMRIPRW